MNLRDLKYLIAVADTLHFGKAAQQCHTSQPTLSMQIKKLEDFLGIILFERTNKQVTLTPAGKVIVDYARKIIEYSNDIITYAKSCSDPLSGEFRLGAFPTIAPYLLPKIIPAITTSMPELTVWLVEEKTPQLLKKLESGELDAAILALPILNTQLATSPLFEDRFRLAVPAHHPLAHRKHISLEHIKDETLLLLEDGHCLREQALQVCQLHGAKETQGFRATSLETLRQMVAAGSGITLIPEIAIPNTSHSDPAICYIGFSKKTPSRMIGIAYRRSTSRTAVIEMISRIIQETMEAFRG